MLDMETIEDETLSGSSTSTESNDKSSEMASMVFKSDMIKE